MLESLWTRQELGLKHSVEKFGQAINYVGGKRKLSHTLLEAMLNDSNIDKPVFYDLFGGGAAMSFQSAYYGLETIYNDLNKDLYILLKDLHTIGTTECIEFFKNNFITKELFKVWQKNTDNFALKTMLLNTYSYGGVMAYYVYNDINSIIKKHAHYAITKNSYEAYEAILAYYIGRSNDSPLCKIIMNLFEYLKSFDWKERTSIFTDFFNKFEAMIQIDYGFLKESLGDDIFNSVINSKQVDILNIYNRYQKSDFKLIRSIDGYNTNLTYIKHITIMLSLLNLCEFENYHLIDFQSKSYDEVEIKHSPSECIIYCDIPYKNFGDRIYVANLKNKFDFERFCDYARKLAKKGYNVYISEYEMPSDFQTLLEIDYISTFNNVTGPLCVVERLFKANGK